MTADRSTLLDCLADWGRTVDKFHRLPADRQAAFLLRQGYPRFGDLLAHVTGWWQEGVRVVEGVRADAHFVYAEPDTDAFNAQVVEQAQGQGEAALEAQFEAMRVRMIHLVEESPAEVLAHPLVQEWLIADILEHYEEHRLPATVFLALGSNLGDRLANLRAAVDALAPEVHVLAESRMYETPPWGYADQPAFLNMAVQAETDLAPEALLRRLKQIEVEVGRQPSFRYGPRQIDLDILFYDDLVLESDALTVPHPRLHERAFVLVPLVDLAPEWMHPVLGQSVARLLAGQDQSGIHLHTA